MLLTRVFFDEGTGVFVLFLPWAAYRGTLKPHLSIMETGRLLKNSVGALIKSAQPCKKKKEWLM